jgi:hypothetical protein
MTEAHHGDADPATELYCSSCGAFAFRIRGRWTTINPRYAPDAEHLS